MIGKFVDLLDTLLQKWEKRLLKKRRDKELDEQLRLF